MKTEKNADKCLFRSRARAFRLATLAATSLGAVSMPSLAHAQAEPTEAASVDNMIIVTAQRRAELSRDVPITITTVDDTALREANVESLLNLDKLAPGVRIVGGGGAYIQPTIRGIGTTLVQTASGSSVGVYVDGFYMPNPLSLSFNFLNVENVQVLKGPQGTLFGRNTTAGAILVTTAEPSTETSAIVEASYERFDEKQLQAYVTTGLAENLAFSVEGQWRNGDGFQRNIYDGDPLTGAGLAPGARTGRSVAKFEDWSVRTGLKFEPSDSVSFLLRYAHTDKNDPSAYLQNLYVGEDGTIFSSGDAIPGTIMATQRRDVSLNGASYFRFKSDAVQLTGNFDLGFADLTSYTQYRVEEIQSFSDLDRSSAAVLALNLPEKDRIMSQELLLNSKPGGRLQYTAGVFLFEHKVQAFVNLAGGTPAFFDFSETGAKTRTYAAFVDATYEVLDNLFLTGGLRYSRDQVRDVYYQTTPGVRGINTYQSNLSDDKLSPRVVLRYKPNDASSVYASFTRGYKAAIPDYRSTSGAEYLLPETIHAYEVGYKYADGAFTAEIAAFRYDYENLQNGYYDQGATILSNAAKSRIKGIEAQFQIEPIEGLQLSASGAYIDAKYREYLRGAIFTPVFIPDNDGDGRPEFSGLEASSGDVSGNRVVRVPKFSGNISARYSMDMAGGRLVASANLAHSSRIYFDVANDFAQGAYDVVSARVEWTDPSDRYTVAIFGDNLFDEKYWESIQPGNGAVGLGWGEPVTYGISLRANF